MHPYMSESVIRGLGLQIPAPGPRADAPVLDPARGHEAPPRPYQGGGIQPGCTADRVMLMGGALNQLIMHPSVVPFEMLYRRLPEEAMFSPDVSPEKPFVGELGAFRVPNSMVLMIFDLRPDIYRFSGVDPTDFLPVESRSLASKVGFEVTVDQVHPGNVQFQLDPIPFQQGASQAFQPPPGNPQQPQPQAAFNIAAANRFANAAGAGLSLLPQRPTRYGARSIPFTLYVRSNSVFQARLVVFRRLRRPVAFFEYDIAGILVPSNWIDTMNECMKPDQGGQGGSGYR